MRRRWFLAALFGAVFALDAHGGNAPSATPVPIQPRTTPCGTTNCTPVLGGSGLGSAVQGVEIKGIEIKGVEIGPLL